MRFVSSVFALAVLGCCFGPSVEAPPAPAPAPAAPSPLSEALSGMGITEGSTSGAAPASAPAPAPSGTALPTDPATAPVAVSAAPAAPAAPAGAAAPAAAPTGAAATPACAEAQAAREQVRAQVRDLRLQLGGAQRYEAAGAAMMACDRDPACLRDPKARTARIDAFDRAKAAMEAETRRLAEAELGLYDADQRVTAACGAP